MVFNLLASLVIHTSWATDFNVALPDQLTKRDKDEVILAGEKNGDETGYSVLGSGQDQDFSKFKGDSFAIPGSRENEQVLSEKEKILSFGNEPMGTYDKESNLVTIKNSEVFKKFYNKGESALSFTYLQDTFDIKDSRGVYQRSFENAFGSKRAGFLLIGKDYYFSKGTFSPFWGGGLGVSFSKGKGIFARSTTTESNVVFQLFQIPVDLHLGFELTPGRYFKVAMVAGPSVMGLLQSRNDKQNGENGKHRRQVSYGYFAQGKLQVSMSNIFSKSTFEMFSLYDLSNMFLDFTGRVHSYNHFQDDIEISGASFGVGFSFEFI